MIVPSYAIFSLVTGAVLFLCTATLYLVRRGLIVNVSTSRGLLWIRLIDWGRWFFQILTTWMLLGAFAPLQVLLFFFTTVVFLQVFAVIAWGIRERQSLGLLLAEVHNVGGSIPDLLEAYGKANLNILGAKAKLTADAVRRGENLLTATRRLRLKLPTPIRLALTSPPKTFQKATLDSSIGSSDVTSISKIAVMGVYLPCLFLFMAGIFTFLAISIIPTFKEIYAEFEIESGGIVVLTWMADYILPNITILVMVGVLYVGFILFFWMLGLQGALRAIPLLGPLLVQSRKASLLESIAFATQQNQSLPDAFDVIRNASSYRSERHVLSLCLMDVQQGKPIKSTLRRIVNGKQAAWLEAAERTNHLPEALANLATLIRLRLNRSIEWCVSLLLPISIIIFAIPVLIICYATIRTLTDMILALS